MKKYLILFLFSLSLCTTHAQIICILCYDQNNPISPNANNLLSNGGFENTTCTPSQFADGYCPSSAFYTCDIANWTCTGGGQYTYANIFDYTLTVIPDGMYAAYFGNSMGDACSILGDTSCLINSSCEVTGIPQGYPVSGVDYGGTIGVSLEQTVNGLVPGNTYVLELWAGGESYNGYFISGGLFGVDIGFGYTFLRCKITETITGIGTRYIIEFNAVSTSHVIKFTNWGHICDYCTELILDDVKLYTLAELSPSVPSCFNLPSALFSAPNNLCPGTCTDFVNLSSGASSYVWNLPGGNPSVSTNVSPTGICYNTPGSYDVTLIATNANGSDTLTIMNYITVFPQPPPQGIMQNGDTLFAISGAPEYQWYYNNNIIIGATNYFYVATQSGNYNVVATDSNGCEVEAVLNNVIATSQFPVSSSQLAIFPNPVEEELIINLPADALAFSTQAGNEVPIAIGIGISTTEEISIYNLIGEKIPLVVNCCPWTVDCRPLPSGIYYLQITQQEKMIRTKFVKSAYR